LKVNKKLCYIVGYSQQELLSKCFQDLTHPEDLPMDQVAVNQLINNEISTYSKEKRYYTNIGDIVWVNVATSLVRDNTNQPDHFIFVVEDITIQKNADNIQIKLTEQIHQAQKIEAIGNLAGGIAHDFNNMLGVILGQAELAMDKLDNTDPLMENIQALTKAANHSARLTRQLLTFARKQKIEPKVLNFNSSVAAMMSMLKRLIGESIILSWDPAPDLWSVKVDPTHIDQVLANLCINARDAITGNGEIFITARNCTLDQKNTITKTHEIPPGEYVKLSVTDNGSGMNEATRTQIFEPFYTTKGVGEGTGLGLSFTLGAVKMNAGFINVTSELGQGATFDIYFQRANTLKEIKERRIETPSDKDAATILLVEDEEMLLKIETEMLENSGYKVLAASGGERAEALFHEHLSKIDLLITDVVMPKVNGMDLAVKLRILSPRLKVLFMSGYPADVLGKQANLKEDAHFLQKPFSMKVLTTKVGEVLNTNE
jgi:PAS domain S-box-containing protein